MECIFVGISSISRSISSHVQGHGKIAETSGRNSMCGINDCHRNSKVMCIFPFQIGERNQTKPNRIFRYQSIGFGIHLYEHEFINFKNLRNPTEQYPFFVQYLLSNQMKCTANSYAVSHWASSCGTYMIFTAIKPLFDCSFIQTIYTQTTENSTKKRISLYL